MDSYVHTCTRSLWEFHAYLGLQGFENRRVADTIVTLQLENYLVLFRHRRVRFLTCHSQGDVEDFHLKPPTIALRSLIPKSSNVVGNPGVKDYRMRGCSKSFQ